MSEYLAGKQFVGIANEVGIQLWVAESCVIGVAPSTE